MKPIRLTHNQFAFLMGLLDRPRGIARSRRDLVAAATPYVMRFRDIFSYSCLNKAVRNIERSYVSRRRVGNRIEFRILPKGRAVLDGRAGPVHIRGFGSWVSSSRPPRTETE
jgi:hypothetical protein